MWAGVELTAGRTPILCDGETQIADCRMVGLYNGDQKSPDHAQGWLYLTSARLCYVDDTHPVENSCAVTLDQIKQVTYIPRFLRQSPKIVLTISAPAQPTRGPVTWVCEICSFSNTLSLKHVSGHSSLPLCENCGVQCTQEPETIPPPPISKTVVPGQENQCPRCTFVNHPYIRECEICGYVLKRHRKIVALQEQVKLSFRSGGAREFFASLERTLGNDVAQSAPLTPTESPKSMGGASSSSLSFGINQLKVELNSGDLDFTNVQTIAMNAKHIMDRLDAHKRITGDHIPSYRLDGQLVLPDFWRDEQSYLAQLSRQVANFLTYNEILLKQGGLMLLFDVYAAYNRVRGTEPVSAQDFDKALQLAPQLELPIQVRVLRSGTKIVESKLWSSPQDRLGRWIKKTDQSQGASIMDTCREFEWSISVAIEELDQAEEEGILCRDDTAAGPRYFANLFAQSL